MPEKASTQPTVTREASRGPALFAFHLPGRPELEIVPAGRWRDWMEATDERWANRCLPLLMANESGWWLPNPRAFIAAWDGDDTPFSVSITYDEPLPVQEQLVSSHFGYGILTWAVPYLFRTEPGWELLARGPANLPKDGITALEGLIESDWTAATFTMNWKLTRPALPVRFEVGEPFCMIVPQRRDDLESIEPRVTQLGSDPDLQAAHLEWARRRDELMWLQLISQVSRLRKIAGAEPDTWEKNYFKGRGVTDSEAPSHRTKRRLRRFESADG